MNQLVQGESRCRFVARVKAVNKRYTSVHRKLGRERKEEEREQRIGQRGRVYMEVCHLSGVSCESETDEFFTKIHGTVCSSQRKHDSQDIS
jgi:hypothetical protein